MPMKLPLAANERDRNGDFVSVSERAARAGTGWTGATGPVRPWLLGVLLATFLTATAAASLAAPGAPRDVELTLDYYPRTLVVSWDAPQSEADEPVIGYRVQWKSSDQSWHSSRESSADASARLHRIYHLTNGTEYTVRVFAVTDAGQGPPSAEVTGTPHSRSEQLLSRIENHVVPTHEGQFPWLRRTWDYLNANGFPVETTSMKPVNTWTLVVDGIATSTFGGSGGQWYNECDDVGFADPALLPIDPGTGLRACRTQEVHVNRISDHVIIHELAHAYTADGYVAPAGDGTALAAALLFLSDLGIHGGYGGCHGLEYFADLMSINILGENNVSAVYWHGCNRSQQPAWARAEAPSVVASATRGEIPDWFSREYDGVDGSPDLERLWSDIKNLQKAHRSQIKIILVFLLRDSFGGYCDNQNAHDSMFNSGPTRNPWRDGGCVPQAPQGLAFSVVGDDAVLSWSPPAGDGGSPIEGYTVQWKSDSQEFDPSRQAVLADLNDLAQVIGRHVGGVGYTARVSAFNVNGDGAAATISTSESKPGLVLSPESLGLAEGTKESYTVALATQPSADVTVAITGHTGTDLTLDETSLTFTNTTWDTPQTVTVTAGQDGDTADDTATLAHTASGGGYVSVTGDVTVTVTDDDTRGVTVSEGTLAIDEGGTGTYTVVLDAQPTGPVTVTPSSDDPGAVTVSGALTFTASDWSTEQEVTVTGVEDSGAADETVTVSHAVSGADYGSVTAGSVTVTVDDDETASTGVTLTVDVGTVAEGAGATTVTVTATLDGATRPAETEVAVVVGSGTATEGTDFAAVGDFTITIPADTASQSATFSLVPTDDDLDEEDETVSVSGTATGLTVAGAELVITDDDTRGVTVSEGTLAIDEGGTGTYTVVLDAQPTGPVTVTPSSDDPGAVTVSGALTFTASDWSTEQEVTVTGVEDSGAADETVTVSHAVSGADYGSVTAGSVTVTVDDDETASTGVTLTVDVGTVAEGAGATTVTVTATLDGATRPAETEVAVVVGSGTATEGTDFAAVGDFTITIPADTASQSATFSLVPTDDDLDEEDETVSVSGTATGLTVAGAELTITDEVATPVSVLATNAAILTPLGADGRYAPGERIEAAVRFNEVVTVIEGSPSVDVALDGRRREARYERGSGTPELVFGYTVTEADGGARKVNVVSGSIALNGATVRNAADELVSRLDLAPFVTEVAIAPETDGNGVWTPGELIKVMVVFSETVSVDLATGTPALAVLADGERRRAAYAGGSGTTTLTFIYAVAHTDGDVKTVQVVANSLELDGATLHGHSGLAAALGHGDARREGVADPARFTVHFEGVPDEHDSTTPFDVYLRFSEAPAAGVKNVHVKQALGVSGGRIIHVRVVDGDRAYRRIRVEPDGLGDMTLWLEPTVDCQVQGALCTAGGEALSETARAAIAGPFVLYVGYPTGYRVAAYEGPGTREFPFPVRLSRAGAAAVTVDYRTVDGTATAGEDYTAVSGTLEFAPGETEKTVLVPVLDDAQAEVLETFTLELSNAVGAAVVSALGGGHIHDSDTGAPLLTAAFTSVPAEHDGESTFAVEFAFSESFKLSARTVRLDAFTVTGGRIAAVKRTDNPHREWKDGLQANRAWRLTIQPDSHAAVTVSLPPTTNCAASGAVCTEDGRKLSNALAARVQGPPGLAVADAEVDEGADAELAFTVSLSRAASGPVTVDYASADGTAVAGEDYTAVSGTLTFAPGETEQTVTVAVLDDAHDEGEETMTLTLSNPVGAHIVDGEATGTIENTDLMPKAWLARFGRTVADQVLDAVETRMGAPRAPGAEVRLAGQRLGLGPLFGAEGAPAGGEAAALRARESEEAEAAQAGRRLAAWLSGAADGEDRSGLETRTVTQRELLLGSAFTLTAASGDGAGGAASLWGRAAVSRFDGREDGLSLDGEVASGLLGADWARERWTAGLVVSHSAGEGGYRGEAGAGTVSSTLTGVWPWGRHALTERVTVWGVAGYGAGTLTLTPEGADGTSLAALRTDLDLMMGSVGMRGVVVEAPADGGIELSVKSDALAVRTTSAAMSGGGSLAASQADVTRLRLGLEGTWRGLALGTGTLEPRLELGARHDGGDAESGFGVDVGGALGWVDPARGLRAELSGRGLVTHQSAGFRDRGFASALVFDPTPGSDRGVSLTLTQTVGAQAAGGVDALLRPDSARGLGAEEEDDEPARRRLEAKLGYGFAVLGGGWTGTPEVGLVRSDTVRETVLGWRLAEGRRSGLVFGLDVEGARRGSAAGSEGPGHRFGLGLGWRLEGAGREGFEVRFEASRREPAGGAAPEHEAGLRLTARW